MNRADLIDTRISRAVTDVSKLRWIKIALAAYCVTHIVDAGAVPITMSSSRSGAHSLWSNSASTNRYSDFTLQDSRSSLVQFAKFDSSLGTLLSAQLSLTSSTSHSTRSIFLPELSGLPVQLGLGAIAQDTERSLHGPFNLFAYYDARVSYRADYRLTVDALNTDLFSAIAAEAAFGSCAQTEDLFGDIGNTNPSCRAGNNGSPLGDFGYNWGPLSGSALSQFIGNDLLRFDTRMTGDAYGHCDDDDVGDYCRVNLAMNWNWGLTLSYIYEPLVPPTDPGTEGGNGGGNSGGGGNPVPVPQPESTTLLIMGIALLAMRAALRRRDLAVVSCFASQVTSFRESLRLVGKKSL